MIGSRKQLTTCIHLYTQAHGFSESINKQFSPQKINLSTKFWVLKSELSPTSTSKVVVLTMTALHPRPHHNRPWMAVIHETPTASPIWSITGEPTSHAQPVEKKKLVFRFVSLSKGSCRETSQTNASFLWFHIFPPYKTGRIFSGAWQSVHVFQLFLVINFNPQPV